MSYLHAMLHDGALAVTASGVIYSGTVSVTALTALLARDPVRRRDAREVLNLLLHQRP